MGWHAIEEKFDPTWPYTYKWGYDAQMDTPYAWQFAGEGDGSVTHRAELAQRFGRPVNIRGGDQMGLASYIPEERKLDGTLVAPPEVQLHGYYASDIHPSVLDHFEQQFPGVVIRRASPRTSKIQYHIGPDRVQIEVDTFEHPHQELAEAKAELAKQFPNHEILLPKLPEDIFAGRPSLLDRANRQAAVRSWISRALPVREPDPVEPFVYPRPKQSFTDRLLKRAGADMDGAMVAIFIPKEVGKKIRVKGGEPLENLHVTLAYFTDKSADRDDWDTVERIVEQIAAQHPKLVGKIGGFGVFNNDEDVLWASPSIPGLAELRHKIVEACEDAGFTVSDEHGWLPHITLEYDHKGKLPSVDDPIPVEVKHLTFAQGEKKTEFAFEGNFEKTTSWEQQDWSWPGTYRFVTDGKEVALEPEDKGEWKGADLDPLGDTFRSHHPDSEPSVSGWAVPTQDGMGYGIWAPTVGYGGENQLGMHDLVATLDKELKKPTHLVEDWREITNPEQYALSLDS